MSPILTPRDLAHLRETESADSVGRLLLDVDGPPVRPSATQPLPAEARLQALAQTQEMHRLYSMGQHNAAFQSGKQALAYWHALQEHAQSCEVLRVLSSTCMEHEQGVEALALARHALRLARLRVLPLALVQSLSLLGVLHGRLHDVGVGESLVLQSLSRARELNNRQALMQTLEALLSVLLEAHEVQRLAGDTASLQATAQRLQRHAAHGLAQSGPMPDNFIDLQLRTQAAAALVACARAADALPVLTQCMELARQAGYSGLAMWARLYGAQASMAMGDDASALASAQMLAPLMTADEPPRLRLAHLTLQAQLAERAGAQERAAEDRAAAHALRDVLLRQRLKLRTTLRRNSEDVLRTLSNLDREWQERGVPPRAPLDLPAADTSDIAATASAKPPPAAGPDEPAAQGRS